MKDQSLTPSKELLVRVRAAFLMRGTTFNSWCKGNGVVRRTAEQSLVGDIQSANAQNLVTVITRAAGLGGGAA